VKWEKKSAKREEKNKNKSARFVNWNICYLFFVNWSLDFSKILQGVLQFSSRILWIYTFTLNKLLYILSL
jgi:hypothetical protein